MNIYKRFREFGGWRLVRAYWRMGLLGRAVVELAKMPFGRSNKVHSYSRLLKHVELHLKTQFRPVLQALKTEHESHDYEHLRSKKVWFCWLQGIDDAPEIVKACLHSQQIVLKDREVIVISEANFSNYVEMPDFFVRRYREGRIPRALFSDVLRLELLIRYGGTWMDASLLCTGTNYPPAVFDCNLFMFRYPGPDGRIASSLSISNWFITSCTNNILLLILRDLLYSYWKTYDCTVNYYIFHQFFAWIAAEYPLEMDHMPRGSSLAAIALGKKLDNNEPYDETWMNAHISRCCFNKLSCRVSPKMKSDPNNYYSHIISFANSL